MGVNSLTYSQDGLALTEKFEGLSLSAYQDPVGIWTIGYGHTGRDVTPGLTITQDQATGLLMSDIAASATFVNHIVDVPLSQNQFDALVDFTFNVGGGAFAGSTLLRMLNASQFDDAAAQFERWVFAHGRELPGLMTRREAERALFESIPQA